ncbi:polysaccharide deacetylase family protein [Inhella sp.]|uniref:polysaccharide deacetylase family protein n=1 Tax=Inhella sp. TaxID=1921806 RepID=UPI0035B1955A
MSTARLALNLLSPAGRNARLSILIFHRVHATPDPMFPGEVDVPRFREILGWVKDAFQVLPLDEAVQRLHQGTLPARAAAITFDDGYLDNHQQALPLLEEAGLSACFFIATGFLDGGRMWNDTLIEAARRSTLDALDVRALSTAYADLDPLPLGSWDERRSAAEQLIRRTKYLPLQERLDLVAEVARISAAILPDDLMMSSAQLRDLRARGMVVGAHTVNHPILARLPLDEARSEISTGREVLEDLLGERIGLFAYPNGKPGEDYLPEHARLVRELGFDAAVTTAPGAARWGQDLMQIPRFTPWDRTPGRFALRMMLNLRS